MIISLSAFADEASEKFSEQIAALKRNNIGYIELRGLDGVNVASLTDEQANEYAKQLREANIAVWSIGSPLGKIDITAPATEHEEMLCRLMKIADIFGTKRIRMFSYFVEREDYAKYRDEVIARLKKLVSIAKGYTLCHENECKIFGATVDNCVDVLDNVDGLYSVFDSSNFIQWDEDMDYAIEKLVHRADYIHVKDSCYDGKAIVPVGYGDGQYERIIKGLKKDTTLTLEPHLFEFTGYKGIDDKELKGKFSYADSNESFDAAVKALKDVLTKIGYREGENGQWIK